MPKRLCSEKISANPFFSRPFPFCKMELQVSQKKYWEKKKKLSAISTQTNISSGHHNAVQRLD